MKTYKLEGLTQKEFDFISTVGNLVREIGQKRFLTSSLTREFVLDQIKISVNWDKKNLIEKSI